MPVNITTVVIIIANLRDTFLELVSVTAFARYSCVILRKCNSHDDTVATAQRVIHASRYPRSLGTTEKRVKETNAADD